MNDLLIKLRQQLVSMIEEIDSYNIPLGDTIVIRRQDFKSINYIGTFKEQHIFEFKNGVKFILMNNFTFPYHIQTYKKLMDDTLEILILNFSVKGYKLCGHTINYYLEDEIKTNLRNLYNPIDEDNKGNTDTEKE